MKYIRKEKAKKMIQNQKKHKLMKYIRYKIQNYLKVLTAKKGYYDDPVDIDIELEKNVAKKKNQVLLIQWQDN